MSERLRPGEREEPGSPHAKERSTTDISGERTRLLRTLTQGCGLVGGVSLCARSKRMLVAAGDARYGRPLRVSTEGPNTLAYWAHCRRVDVIGPDARGSSQAWVSSRADDVPAWRISDLFLRRRSALHSCSRGYAEPRRVWLGLSDSGSVGCGLQDGPAAAGRPMRKSGGEGLTAQSALAASDEP